MDIYTYLFLISLPFIIIGLGYLFAKQLSEDDKKDMDSIKRIENYSDSNVDYDKLFKERK